MKYKILVLNPLAYFIRRFNIWGLSGLLTPCEVGYPRILALGYCNHKLKEIGVCKVLNWQLRVLHEEGHEAGLKHTWKIGYVMFPLEFGRGNKYE